MTDANTYDIQLFENTEFKNLTVLVLGEDDNGVYFIAKEVAEILGYSNTKKAIQVHVDAEDKSLLQER